MPSADTLIAFLGVSILLGLTPGPDNIFVLLQSAQRGWRAGMAVVVGLCCGLVVHTGAVALGLAAVFAASAVAFTVLKLLGVAYLAYLAWQALRAPLSSAGPDAGAQGTAPTAAPSLWRMVGRGMVMNLSNPKVLVFFLAFLPQFADQFARQAKGQVKPAHPRLGLGQPLGQSRQGLDALQPQQLHARTIAAAQCQHDGFAAAGAAGEVAAD